MLSNRKSEKNSELISLLNTFTDHLDQEEIFRNVVRFLSETFNFFVIRTYSVHTGRKKIIFHAGIKNSQLLDMDERYHLELDDETNKVAQVARTGEAFEGQYDKEPFFWKILPLKYDDEVLGVLEIGTSIQKPLISDVNNVLETLADYIASIMRNALLYRSELWRREVADNMQEVAGLLASNISVDRVLKTILTVLEQSLPCDAASIWLSDEPVEDELRPRLNIAAVHLTSKYTNQHAENDNSLTNAEIVQLLERADVPGNWLAEALETPSPVLRSYDDPYEPLGAILDFPSNYSAVAAPLQIGEKLIGLLVLVHHKSGRYGYEVLRRSGTFANYAAVAIGNTMLYETAHDQAWISTVLLQVTEATQSLTTTEDLAETLVRITPLLVGVESCSFFMWDSSTDVFTLVSSFGLSENLSVSSEPVYITLGEIPVFDQLLIAKGPTLVSSGDLSEAINLPDKSERSFVLFPMISHGEVMGALLIEYSLDSGEEKSDKMNVGWDEKFAVIQGIAHQTAITVENIKLIDAQQDEAYISVALLQVAQAVVSQNDLNDILESIVRITPILVGVKRSLIFIWDKDAQIFRLSQTYGLNRDELAELGESIDANTFPILDAAVAQDGIIFNQLTAEFESPLTWRNIDGSSFETVELESFGEASFQQGDEKSEALDAGYFLKSQSALLQAFPLSVKGTVLGVLVTQEMELAVGHPSQQVREKRLEITNGIAQQAAIALQNDRFQKEVLERERLEREFQLARDIQQTFLPESLPKHHRWDVNSLWRPARQVSGDFYDIIELPNNRWGLVIADVADKGMPAALYMTLIRTLIRAIAREESSPAVVLRRVNDLMVADSKSGMFVTIVYAVLSLDKGSLTYANAGHNPPLLVRCSENKLEKLPGTAMALGIFEGIDVAELSVEIKDGDCLILYTDGITESFSPDNQMFGEKRLIEVVTNGSPQSSEAMSKSIDRAVLEFTQGDTSSDDITLVVLNRQT